jgi:V/A-type H+-transporting ATPase subunit A
MITTQRTDAMMTLLRRGEDVARMAQVAGEEGISLDDFVVAEAARFVDMVFLQQDAFDKIDASVSLDRQRQPFDCVRPSHLAHTAFLRRKRPVITSQR